MHGHFRHVQRFPTLVASWVSLSEVFVSFTGFESSHLFLGGTGSPAASDVATSEATGVFHLSGCTFFYANSTGFAAPV